MAYIYKIVNEINDKIYIGKTEFSIEKRFKEHCKDFSKERCKDRPLYRAMNKYGIENFHVELIEETDNPEDRETYWIEYFGSFKNGYNATVGGDGRKYIDYDLVVATYNKTQSLIETANLCGCDRTYVGKILQSRKIPSLSSMEVNKNKYGQYIDQFDINNNYIKTFKSIKEAAKELRPDSSSLGGVTSHISDVCKGKRKTAYGYIWRYSNIN